MTGDRSCPINPLANCVVYAKGNMASIIETAPINLSRTPGVIDNVFVEAYCSPDEIPDIDPLSVDHELTLLFFKLTLRSKSNIRQDCIYAF
jgi:hypothetical protein